jgi:hypothetical protein
VTLVNSTGGASEGPLDRGGVAESKHRHCISPDLLNWEWQTDRETALSNHSDALR